MVEEATEENIAEFAWAIGPNSSTEFDGSRQNLVVRARARFPPNADVRETDEITAVASDGVMPKRYQVVGLFAVPGRRTQRTKYLHVDLEAVS